MTESQDMSNMLSAFFSGEMEGFEDEANVALPQDSKIKKSLDFVRDPAFYQSEDTIFISDRVKMRLFYDINRADYCVFFRKENDLAPNHSHMFVSGENIKYLRKIVQETIDEIEIRPYNELPVRHKTSPFAHIEDKDEETYWDPSLCNYLPDKSMAVRSYKSPDGIWLIRILTKKRGLVGLKFKRWIGRSFSMRVSEATSFCLALMKLEKDITAADQTRLEEARAKKEQRDAAEQEDDYWEEGEIKKKVDPVVVDLSPPPSV